MFCSLLLLGGSGALKDTRQKLLSPQVVLLRKQGSNQRSQVTRIRLRIEQGLVESQLTCLILSNSSFLSRQTLVSLDSSYLPIYYLSYFLPTFLFASFLLFQVYVFQCFVSFRILCPLFFLRILVCFELQISNNLTLT